MSDLLPPAEEALVLLKVLSEKAVPPPSAIVDGISRALEASGAGDEVKAARLLSETYHALGLKDYAWKWKRQTMRWLRENAENA